MSWAAIICRFRGHRWTSVAQQVGKGGELPKRYRPSKDDTKESVAQLFRDFARIYCDRCHKPHPRNP